MKTVQERLSESRERLAKAVRFEKTDRIPVAILGNVAFAKYADANVEIADFIDRPKWTIDKAIEAVESLKYVDAIGQLGVYPGKAFAGKTWMSRIKLPGKELRRDELWQIDEISAMKVEDYDYIIDKGWKAYRQKYFNEHLNLKQDDLDQLGDCIKYAEQKLATIGCVDLCPAVAPTTFDCISSGRGIINFIRDLRKMPDKVKAVLDIVLEEQMDEYKDTLRKFEKGSYVFVQPAVRGNCDFFSRKIFEEFIFPHFRIQANTALEAGCTPFFHMDSNWNLFLDLFTEFPKGKCIFDTDGITDIYKVKEVLGGRMCITGNISPSALTLGTPDEVYNEVKKQISELGPEGYIISASCAVPPNAKPENIKAMVEACI